jgi:hypothetical protein
MEAQYYTREEGSAASASDKTGTGILPNRLLEKDDRVVYGWTVRLHVNMRSVSCIFLWRPQVHNLTITDITDAGRFFYVKSLHWRKILGRIPCFGPRVKSAFTLVRPKVHLIRFSTTLEIVKRQRSKPWNPTSSFGGSWPRLILRRDYFACRSKRVIC